jgi:hypothetical protein
MNKVLRGGSWKDYHSYLLVANRYSQFPGSSAYRFGFRCASSNSGSEMPIFVYPVDGQTLDYEGNYLFKVEPMANAQGFLWGFFQNGEGVWENWQDEGTLSGNEYGILEDSVAHSKFVIGSVEVWVRALINGEWTEPTMIIIYLE